ncbi:MAG TPA: branched-chain amino acid ABC transporter permease [Firmicutes bacterium]|nr:branched-chain amino acid ABC transporter permease [Bacillota bacterium]
MSTVRRFWPILGLLVWAVLPAVVKDPYVIHMLFMVTMFSILAVSLNIAVGYTGLSNLSHATFFGIGAYVAALLSIKTGASFLITLLAGGLVALGFGLLLGLPTLRLKGFYLALVTIGFGQIIRLTELNWISLTNGPMGIPGIPTARLAGYEFTPVAFNYYALVILLLEIEAVRRISDSRIGRALMAIKNDEIVANALGVNITYYKVLAFALSSLFAGMAGSIYAHYVTFVSPDSFTMADSVSILCMVILGGSGTLLGPVIGAVALVVIPELLRFASLYRMIFVGAAMVIGILVREGGLGQTIKEAIGRFGASLHREVKA